MRDEKGRFIKGYKPVWSKKSRLKVSQSLRGVNNWSKGKKLTEEHKEKCRKNASKYWLGKKRPNLTGELHPNWKKNKVSPLRLAIRESFKYKSWRMDILRRDGFKCVFCRKTNKLEADHYPKRFVDLLKENDIKTFDEAMECEDLWRLDIARTLCNQCHRKTPSWGKNGTMNKDDIV